MIRSEKMERLLNRCKEEEEEIPYFAFPGGYPLIYYTSDGGVLCPKCVQDNRDLINDPDDSQWYIVDYDVYYEGADINCDHCNDSIKSAYGDPEQEE